MNENIFSPRRSNSLKRRRRIYAREKLDHIDELTCSIKTAYKLRNGNFEIDWRKRKTSKTFQLFRDRKSCHKKLLKLLLINILHYPSHVWRRGYCRLQNTSSNSADHCWSIMDHVENCLLIVLYVDWLSCQYFISPRYWLQKTEVYVIKKR